MGRGPGLPGHCVVIMQAGRNRNSEGGPGVIRWMVWGQLRTRWCQGALASGAGHEDPATSVWSEKPLQRQDFSYSKCWSLCDLAFQQQLAITKEKVIIEKLGNVNPKRPCLYDHNEKLLH